MKIIFILLLCLAALKMLDIEMKIKKNDNEIFKLKACEKEIEAKLKKYYTKNEYLELMSEINSSLPDSNDAVEVITARVEKLEYYLDQNVDSEV